MVLLRRLLGDVLRERRREQGRTLREVSSRARVSLGYLSEVERGQKEASSELLGSICEALDLPLSSVLRDVSDHLALVEQVESVDSVGCGPRCRCPPRCPRARCTSPTSPLRSPAERSATALAGLPPRPGGRNHSPHARPPHVNGGLDGRPAV